MKQEALIDKYVEAHADCRWLDAGELRDLLNSFANELLAEAVEGKICGRVYDHINVRFADGVGKYLTPKNISHIPANVSKYNIGDKVRVLVLKAEED